MNGFGAFSLFFQFDPKRNRPQFLAFHFLGTTPMGIGVLKMAFWLSVDIILSFEHTKEEPGWF